jgi:ribosome-binding factor A
MKPFRLARLGEVIREVASETILFELNDPRIKNVTVTRAEVSADLQNAKVYVSIMGDDRDAQVCLHGLRNAAGYVQKKVGERVKLRYIPILQFVLDKGVKNSLEVTRLINEALAQGGKPAETTGPAEGSAQEEAADDDASS